MESSVTLFVLFLRFPSQYTGRMAAGGGTAGRADGGSMAGAAGAERNAEAGVSLIYSRACCRFISRGTKSWRVINLRSDSGRRTNS